jgi:hypothetical protein
MNEEAPAPPTVRDHGVALADLAGTAADAYGREDLAARLRRHRAALVELTARVVVAGEYKQGKSSLVNSLLGVAVCPVDDDIATAVPMVLRHAEQAEAIVMTGSARQTAVARPIPVEEIPEYALEGGDAEARPRAAWIEVGLPRRLLAEGLVVVDTPGVGGISAAHGTATLGMLPTADAVLFVSDAAQELTGPELDFLRRAQQITPRLLCVMTKIDLYPEWRRIRDLNIDHLTGLGIAQPIVVSSPMRHLAVAESDAVLNVESGFPTLVRTLQGIMSDLLGEGTLEVAQEVTWATGQLEGAFLSERSSLADPQGNAALLARLEGARAVAERLGGSTAGWQTTLSDGFADLTSDVDHDLRTRFRTLADEADALIEGGDPGKRWDEIASWLERRMANEVAENFTLMTRRARELTAQVADRFGEEEMGFPLSVSVDTPRAAAEALEVREGPGAGTRVPGQALVALRGAYGGMLMAGVFAQMAGVAGVIVNPVLGVVGVLLAVKAVREQRQRELAARQQHAKATIRRYVDDAAHTIGKESRDALRRVQRDLRDGLAARAEEIQRSAKEAVGAAEAAIRTDDAGRQKRLADVDAELGRLAGLRERAGRVATLAKPTSGP